MSQGYVYGYKPPKPFYMSRFKLGGNTPDEAISKGLIHEYSDFYVAQNKLIGNVHVAYEGAQALPAVDDIYQKGTFTNLAISSFDNIQSQRNPLSKIYNTQKGNGSILSFDTETMYFGDKSYITEIGLNEAKYVNGRKLSADVDTASIVFGISKEQHFEATVIAKKVKDGVSLTNKESVTAERLGKYGGNFLDRFRRVNESDLTFFKGLGMSISTDAFVMKTLNENAGVGYNDIMSGIKNLTTIGSGVDNIMGNSLELGSEKGNSNFTQIFEALKKYSDAPEQALTAFNATFDVNVLNEVAGRYTPNSSNMNVNSVADIMDVFRVHSRNTSQAEYIQQIARDSGINISNVITTGGRLEHYAAALGIETESHMAGADAKLLNDIISMDRFMTVVDPETLEPSFINMKDIIGDALETEIPKSTTGSTYLFNRDIGISNELGDYAIANGSPIKSVPNTGRYFKPVEAKNISVPVYNTETKDFTDTADRYMVKFQNQAYGFQDEFIMKTFDDEAQYKKQMSSSTTAFPDKNAIEKQINQQQKLMDSDLARREYESFFDTGNVKMSGSRKEVGGYKKMELYMDMYDDYTNVINNQIKTNPNFIQPTIEALHYKDNAASLLLDKVVADSKDKYSNYEASTFRRMYGKLTDEYDFLKSVRKTVGSKRNLNVMQKTRAASFMKNRLEENISPGRTITNAEGYSYQVTGSSNNNRYHRYERNDIIYGDVFDAQGEIKKINLVDVDRGTSDLMRAYGGTDKGDAQVIDEMIAGVTERFGKTTPAIKSFAKSLAGDNVITPYAVASSFSSILADDYEFLNGPLGQKSVYSDIVSEMSSLSKEQAGLYADQLSVHLNSTVTEDMLDKIAAKSVLNTETTGDRFLATKQSVVSLMDVDENIIEIPLRDAIKMKVEGGLTLQDTIQRETGAFMKQESELRYFNLNDRQVRRNVTKDLVPQLMDRLNYNQSNSAPELKNLLNGMFLSESYGLSRTTGVSSVVYMPENQQLGAYVFSSKSEGISSVIEAMDSLDGVNTDSGIRNIMQGNAAVIHMDPLRIRQTGNGNKSVSVALGDSVMERFLGSNLNYYKTTIDGKDTLHMNVQSGEELLASSYRVTGENNFLKNVLEGRYEQAGRAVKNAQTNAVRTESGNVGIQTIKDAMGNTIKTSVPNLSDTQNANLLDISALFKALPDMVESDPDGTDKALRGIFMPFIERAQGNNNWGQFDGATAARIANMPKFREFMFLHLNAMPLAESTLYTDLGWSAEKIQDTFGNKAILDVMADFTPSKESEILWNGLDDNNSSNPLNVIKTLRDNRKNIFEPVKEHNLKANRISLDNPLKYNQYAMWGPYNRPTALQAHTAKSLDVDSTGNSVFKKSRIYAPTVGTALTPISAYNEQQASYTWSGLEEIKSRYSDKSVMSYVRQMDDLELHNKYKNFEAAGTTTRERALKQIDKRTTEGKRLAKIIEGATDEQLDTMYKAMKDTYTSTYEGVAFVRPSLSNTDYISGVDMRQWKESKIIDLDDADKQSIRTKLEESGGVIKSGSYLTGEDSGSLLKYTGVDGKILDIDEFIQTGRATVLPDRRSTGMSKMLFGDAEKHMVLGVNYEDQMSKLGVMSKDQLDDLSDAIFSPLFGERTGFIANQEIYKHNSGSILYGSKMNAIVDEYNQSGTVINKKDFVDFMNSEKSGFKDWGFELKDDLNPIVSKRVNGGIITMSYDKLLESDNYNSYKAEMDTLIKGIRSGTYLTDQNNIRGNIIKTLDYLEETNSSFTNASVTLSQDSQGGEYSQDSRIRNINALKFADEETKIGYNASEDGRRYEATIQDEMEKAIFGTDDAQPRSKKQQMRYETKLESEKIIRSMNQSLDNMGTPEKLNGATNVLDVKLSQMTSIRKPGVSGYDREAIQRTFFTHRGKPSAFLKSLAGPRAPQIDVIRLQLDEGLTVDWLQDPSVKGSGKTLSQVLIPIQDVIVTDTDAYYTKSQKAISTFINEAMNYKNSTETQTVAKARVQKSFETMVGRLDYDTTNATSSMYHQLLDRIKLPGSGQQQAQRIDSPMLAEMMEPKKKWNGRNFREQYDYIEKRNLKGKTGDFLANLKIQNHESAESFRKIELAKYAERIRGGEYLPLLNDPDGAKYKGKGIDINGNEVDVYRASARTSRAGLEHMNVNFGKQGMALYDDTGLSGKLRTMDTGEGNWTPIKRKEVQKQFMQNYLGEDFIETSDHGQDMIDIRNKAKYQVKNADGNITYVDYEDHLRDLEAQLKQANNQNKRKSKRKKNTGDAESKQMIRKLNENIKTVKTDGNRIQIEQKKIDDAISFLAEKFFKEKGIDASSLRYPAFELGSIVNLDMTLDDTMNSNSLAVVSDPFTAKLQNLDLDGDSTFESDYAGLNEGKMSPELKKALQGSKMRNNLNNREVIANIVENIKFSNSLTDEDLFTLNEMETRNPELLKKIKSSPNDYTKFKEDYYGNTNTLTDKVLKFLATRSKMAKDQIGGASVPSNTMRLILEDLISVSERTGDDPVTESLRKIVKDTVNLTSKGGVGGIFTILEQKGIDVKHENIMSYTDLLLFKEGTDKLLLTENVPETHKDYADYMLKKQKYVSRMLDGGGAKMYGEVDYLSAHKSDIDAAYIISHTRENIIAEQEALRIKANEIIAGTKSSVIPEEAITLQNQIKRLDVTRGFRSIYDLTQIQDAKLIFGAVQESENYLASRRRRSAANKLKNDAPHIMQHGTSSIVANLSLGENKYAVSDINAGRDIFFLKDEHKMRSFMLDTKTTTKEGFSLFQELDLKKTAETGIPEFIDNSYIGQDISKIDERFTKQRMNLQNVIHYEPASADSTVMAAQEAIIRERAIEQVTLTSLNPDERYLGSRSREAVYDYMTNHENWKTDTFKALDEMDQAKYKLLSEHKLTNPEVSDMVNNFLSIAKNYNRSAGYDNGEALRSINTGIINSNGESTVMSMFKEYAYNSGAATNDQHRNNISNIVGRTKGIFNNKKTRQEFLDYYGNYWDDLYSVKDIADVYSKKTGYGSEESLNVVKNITSGINNSTLRRQQDTIYGLLGSTENMDTFFNLKGKPLDRQIAFGSYFGLQSRELLQGDIDILQKEITDIGDSDNAMLKHASMKAQEVINAIKADKETVKVKGTLNEFGRRKDDEFLQSKIKNVLDKMVQYDNIPPEQSIPEEPLQQPAPEVGQRPTRPGGEQSDIPPQPEPQPQKPKSTATPETIEDVTGNMKHKSMSSAAEAATNAFGKVKGVGKAIAGAGGAALSLGAFSLFAIGLVSNIMHKDEQKSPLTPEAVHGSAKDAQTVVQHNGLTDVTGRSKVIYSDPGTGYNFKVSANTARYVTQQQVGNGFAGSGAFGNSQIQVNVEEDRSRVSQNWLAERFADMV